MPARFLVESKGAMEAYEYLHSVGQGVTQMLKALGYDALMAVKIEYVHNISGYYPGPNQEHVLAVRSGALRRFALAQQIAVESDGLAWGLPAGQKQSIIGAKLEAGGQITPKAGRFLRIPLPAALTTKGVDRNAGRSLREDKSYFVARSHAGNPIIFKKQEKNRPPVPWYLLKTSVNIRGRHGLEDAVRKVEATKMEGLEQKHMQVLLRGKP